MIVKSSIQVHSKLIVNDSDIEETFKSMHMLVTIALSWM